MIRFNRMSEEAKEVYLLVLCELLIEKISNSDGYEIVVEALERCWEWIKSKNVEADELYVYLENLDEEDIMTYMQLDKNKVNEPVWICMANTLAYIIRDAYQYEKQVYMPETIECVDDETVQSFMYNFAKTFTDDTFGDKLLEYMLMNYSEKNSNQSVDVYKIKQFVNENIK